MTSTLVKLDPATKIKLASIVAARRERGTQASFPGVAAEALKLGEDFLCAQEGLNPEVLVASPRREWGPRNRDQMFARFLLESYDWHPLSDANERDLAARFRHAAPSLKTVAMPTVKRCLTMWGFERLARPTRWRGLRAIPAGSQVVELYATALADLALRLDRDGAPPILLTYPRDEAYLEILTELRKYHARLTPGALTIGARCLVRVRIAGHRILWVGPESAAWRMVHAVAMNADS